MLELQFLCNIDIKSQKCWKRIALANGNVMLLAERDCSLIFMGNGELLSLPNSQVFSFIKQSVFLTISNNGDYLAGMNENGGVFVWQKSSNVHRSIPQLQLFTSSPRRVFASDVGQSLPYMAISDTGLTLLVVNSAYQVFVWVADDVNWFEDNVGMSKKIFEKANKRGVLLGGWSLVSKPQPIKSPSFDDDEACVDSVFDLKQGDTGYYNLTSILHYDHHHLSIIFLFLFFRDLNNIHSPPLEPTFEAHWRQQSHSLASLNSNNQSQNTIPPLQPIKRTGALLTRISRDGQTVAIVMNQPHGSHIVFTSASNHVILSSSVLLGDTSLVSKNNQSHWIEAVTWSQNDFFLLVINGYGVVNILSRFGETVCLSVIGLSEHPIRGYGLNLHPPMATSSTFNICSDFTRPLFLTTNGTNISALQFTRDLSCLAYLTDLINEANNVLETSYNGVKFFKGKSLLSNTILPQPSTSATSVKPPINITFFNFDHSLQPLTNQSNSPVTKNKSKKTKITFTESDKIMTLTNKKNHVLLSQNTSIHLSSAVAKLLKLLTAAWGTACCHRGLWTLQHEALATQLVAMVARAAEIMMMDGRRKKKNENPGVANSFHFVLKLLHLLKLNNFNIHQPVICGTNQNHDKANNINNDEENYDEKENNKNKNRIINNNKNNNKKSNLHNKTIINTTMNYHIRNGNMINSAFLLIQHVNKAVLSSLSSSAFSPSSSLFFSSSSSSSSSSLSYGIDTIYNCYRMTERFEKILSEIYSSSSSSSSSSFSSFSLFSLASPLSSSLSLKPQTIETGKLKRKLKKLNYERKVDFPLIENDDGKEDDDGSGGNIQSKKEDDDGNENINKNSNNNNDDVNKSNNNNDDDDGNEGKNDADDDTGEEDKNNGLVMLAYLTDEMIEKNKDSKEVIRLNRLLRKQLKSEQLSPWQPSKQLNLWCRTNDLFFLSNRMSATYKLILQYTAKFLKALSVIYSKKINNNNNNNKNNNNNNNDNENNSKEIEQILVIDDNITNTIITQQTNNNNNIISPHEQQLATLKLLLSLLSTKLKAFNTTPPLKSVAEQNQLNYEHMTAIYAWMDQLLYYKCKQPNNTRVCRILHSVLYSHLMYYDTFGALQLVEKAMRCVLLEKMFLHKQKWDEWREWMKMKEKINDVSMETKDEKEIKNKENTKDMDNQETGNDVIVENESETAPEHQDFIDAFFDADSFKIMAEKMRQPIEFFVPSNQPIKKLIRTMGRFISSYSTGKRLLIFPPHHPFPLPPHWMNTDTNSVISKRRIELDAILVSKATSLQTTHAIFTPYRALQYLLLTSSMCDVIALLSSSGSRRAAVYVSAAVEEFRKGVFSKSPYILSKLNLPTHLSTKPLLRQLLIHITNHYLSKDGWLEETEEVERVFEDVILCGAVCGVEVVVGVVRILLLEMLETTFGRRLDRKVERLSEDNIPHLRQPIMSQKVKLPLPPVHYPQPSIDKMEATRLSAANKRELSLRFKLHQLFSLVLVILNSTNTIRPLISMYSAEVIKACKKVNTIGSDEVLHKYLSTSEQQRKQTKETQQNDDENSQQDNTQKQTNPTPQESPNSLFDAPLPPSDLLHLYSAFRDMCSVTWFLLCRDHFNVVIRKKEMQAVSMLNGQVKTPTRSESKSPKQTDKRKKRQTGKGADKGMDQWWAINRGCVQASGNVLPFSQMMKVEEEENDDGGFDDQSNDNNNNNNLKDLRKQIPAMQSTPPSHLLQHTLLSSLFDLPSDLETATITAKYFPDTTKLHPDTYDRLDNKLKTWESAFASKDEKSKRSGSPRGTTMAAQYFKMAESMKRKEKVFRGFDYKVKFETLYDGCVLVFNGEDNNNNINNNDNNNNKNTTEVGARVFETSSEYLEFLDELFVLMLSQPSTKTPSSENKKTQQQIITINYKEIRENELKNIIINNKNISDIMKMVETDEGRMGADGNSIVNITGKETLKRLKRLRSIPNVSVNNENNNNSNNENNNNNNNNDNINKRNDDDDDGSGESLMTVSYSSEDMNLNNKNNNHSNNNKNNNNNNTKINNYNSNSNNDNNRSSINLNNNNNNNNDVEAVSEHDVTKHGNNFMKNIKNTLINNNNNSNNKNNKPLVKPELKVDFSNGPYLPEENKMVMNSIGPWVFENFTFGGKEEKIVTWLSMWAERGIGGDGNSNVNNKNNKKTGNNDETIKGENKQLKVPAKQLLYSLWLLGKPVEEELEAVEVATQYEPEEEEVEEEMVEVTEEKKEVLKVDGESQYDFERPKRKKVIKKVNKEIQTSDYEDEDGEEDVVVLYNGEMVEAGVGGDGNDEGDEDNDGGKAMVDGEEVKEEKMREHELPLASGLHTEGQLEGHLMKETDTQTEKKTLLVRSTSPILAKTMEDKNVGEKVNLDSKALDPIFEDKEAMLLQLFKMAAREEMKRIMEAQNHGILSVLSVMTRKQTTTTTISLDSYDDDVYNNNNNNKNNNNNNNNIYTDNDSDLEDINTNNNNNNNNLTDDEYDFSNSWSDNSNNNIRNNGQNNNNNNNNNINNTTTTTNNNNFNNFFPLLSRYKEILKKSLQKDKKNFEYKTPAIAFHHGNKNKKSKHQTLHEKALLRYENMNDNDTKNVNTLLNYEKCFPENVTSKPGDDGVGSTDNGLGSIDDEVGVLRKGKGSLPHISLDMNQFELIVRGKSCEKLPLLRLPPHFDSKLVSIVRGLKKSPMLPIQSVENVQLFLNENFKNLNNINNHINLNNNNNNYYEVCEEKILNNTLLPVKLLKLLSIKEPKFKHFKNIENFLISKKSKTKQRDWGGNNTNNNNKAKGVVKVKTPKNLQILTLPTCKFKQLPQQEPLQQTEYLIDRIPTLLQQQKLLIEQQQQQKKPQHIQQYDSCKQYFPLPSPKPDSSLEQKKKLHLITLQQQKEFGLQCKPDLCLQTKQQLQKNQHNSKRNSTKLNSCSKTSNFYQPTTSPPPSTSTLPQFIHISAHQQSSHTSFIQNSVSKPTPSTPSSPRKSVYSCYPSPLPSCASNALKTRPESTRQSLKTSLTDEPNDPKLGSEPQYKEVVPTLPYSSQRLLRWGSEEKDRPVSYGDHCARDSTNIGDDIDVVSGRSLAEKGCVGESRESKADNVSLSRQKFADRNKSMYIKPNSQKLDTIDEVYSKPKKASERKMQSEIKKVSERKSPDSPLRLNKTASDLFEEISNLDEHTKKELCVSLCGVPNKLHFTCVPDDCTSSYLHYIASTFDVPPKYMTEAEKLLHEANQALLLLNQQLVELKKDNVDKKCVDFVSESQAMQHSLCQQQLQLLQQVISQQNATSQQNITTYQTQPCQQTQPQHLQPSSTQQQQQSSSNQQNYFPSEQNVYPQQTKKSFPKGSVNDVVKFPSQNAQKNFEKNCELNTQQHVQQTCSQQQIQQNCFQQQNQKQIQQNCLQQQQNLSQQNQQQISQQHTSQQNQQNTSQQQQNTLQSLQQQNFLQQNSQKQKNNYNEASQNSDACQQICSRPPNSEMLVHNSRQNPSTRTIKTSQQIASQHLNTPQQLNTSQQLQQTPQNSQQVLSQNISNQYQQLSPSSLNSFQQNDIQQNISQQHQQLCYPQKQSTPTPSINSQQLATLEQQNNSVFQQQNVLLYQEKLPSLQPQQLSQQKNLSQQLQHPSQQPQQACISQQQNTQKQDIMSQNLSFPIQSTVNRCFESNQFNNSPQVNQQYALCSSPQQNFASVNNQQQLAYQQSPMLQNASSLQQIQQLSLFQQQKQQQLNLSQQQQIQSQQQLPSNSTYFQQDPQLSPVQCNPPQIPFVSQKSAYSQQQQKSTSKRSSRRGSLLPNDDEDADNQTSKLRPSKKSSKRKPSQPVILSDDESSPEERPKSRRSKSQRSQDEQARPSKRTTFTRESTRSRKSKREPPGMAYLPPLTDSRRSNRSLSPATNVSTSPSPHHSPLPSPLKSTPEGKIGSDKSRKNGEHPESSIDSRLKIMDEIAGRIECAVSDNKNMYNQLQNYHQTLQQNNTVEQQLRECQLQQASIIQQILLQQKNGGSQNEQQKQLLDKFSLYTDQKPQKIKYICVACPQDGGASKKQRSSSRKISLKQDDSTILLEVQPEQTTPLKQKGSDSSTGSVSNKEELPCNEASKRRSSSCLKQLIERQQREHQQLIDSYNNEQRNLLLQQQILQQKQQCFHLKKLSQQQEKLAEEHDKLSQQNFSQQQQNFFQKYNSEQKNISEKYNSQQQGLSQQKQQSNLSHPPEQPRFSQQSTTQKLSEKSQQQKTSKISQQQHSSGLSQKQQQLSGLSQQQQIASNLSQQQQTTDVQDTLPFQQPATTDDLKQSMCQSSCQQDDLPPFDLNECRKMYQQRLQNIQMFHLVDAPSFEDPPAKKKSGSLPRTISSRMDTVRMQKKMMGIKEREKIAANILKQLRSDGKELSDFSTSLKSNLNKKYKNKKQDNNNNTNDPKTNKKKTKNNFKSKNKTSNNTASYNTPYNNNISNNDQSLTKCQKDPFGAIRNCLEDNLNKATKAWEGAHARGQLVKKEKRSVPPASFYGTNKDRPTLEKWIAYKPTTYVQRLAEIKDNIRMYKLGCTLGKRCLKETLTTKEKIRHLKKTDKNINKCDDLDPKCLSRHLEKLLQTEHLDLSTPLLSTSQEGYFSPQHLTSPSPPQGYLKAPNLDDFTSGSEVSECIDWSLVDQICHENQHLVQSE